MQFDKLTSSVLLAVLYASATAATPLFPAAKYATHRVREISSDFKLVTFNPPSNFQVRSIHVVVIHTVKLTQM